MTKPDAQGQPVDAGYQPYASVVPYITKDGSEIRELMHPTAHGNKNQSLAEAKVPVGGKTLLHLHIQTEELYHITQGKGILTLGSSALQVKAGDTLLIAPGTPHCIENTGEAPLFMLCCCSPAYAHEDTHLISHPHPSE